jgi:hypothetical protein
VWVVAFVRRGEPPISRERPHERQERRFVFDSLRIRLRIGIHAGSPFDLPTAVQLRAALTAGILSPMSANTRTWQGGEVPRLSNMQLIRELAKGHSTGVRCTQPTGHLEEHDRCRPTRKLPRCSDMGSAARAPQAVSTSSKMKSTIVAIESSVPMACLANAQHQRRREAPFVVYVVVRRLARHTHEPIRPRVAPVAQSSTSPSAVTITSPAIAKEQSTGSPRSKESMIEPS